MHLLWTLGGLSLPELIRRTARESWQDSVFGQGGRMAFYQFLAIFPALAIFLAMGARLPHLADHITSALRDFSSGVFPEQVSQLLQNALDEHNNHPRSGIELLFTLAGASWAALNSTWAMVYGLNRAYEVQERRSRWQLAIVITSLTLTMAVTGLIALLVILRAKQLDGGPMSKMLEWVVLITALSFAFAVFYRFAPNVRDHQWCWSTPGAALALLLWLGATFAARIYFGRVNDYSRAYGHLNGVAMLLLWLYITNGAILMGGEMNSEIQKAVTAPGGK